MVTIHAWWPGGCQWVQRGRCPLTAFTPLTAGAGFALAPRSHLLWVRLIAPFPSTERAQSRGAEPSCGHLHGWRWVRWTPPRSPLSLHPCKRASRIRFLLRSLSLMARKSPRWRPYLLLHSTGAKQRRGPSLVLAVKVSVSFPCCVQDGVSAFRGTFLAGA